MNDKMPRTPFSTPLSGSARETELRIRNIMSGAKKRPPLPFLILMLRRLSENEMTWLKNRTHDHRPEVKSLACMVYTERFSRQARNQKKQELSIQTLTLSP